MKFWKMLTAVSLLALLLAACAPTAAPPAQTSATPTPTPAAIVTATPTAEPEVVDEEEAPEIAFVNEEQGGTVLITGLVGYTNPFFTAGVAQPLVILEDQAGFVDRDRNYLMPLASQTLGQITSDFFESPFGYSIALPIRPQGAYRDVDNDELEEQGVQIFAVAYWTNTFGDPFLEERDLGGGGWSTAYASTRISEDFETEREIVGGKLLVYAADDAQQFPIDFGEDGLLFSIDDTNVITLPQGYTVVDLDTVPFTFDRSSEQVIDLIEPTGAALVDFSDLSYTEAFDAFVDKLSKEYAFTEYKEIDWEALIEEYRPLILTAEAAGDSELYRRALRDMLWQIPDGHVSGPFLQDEFAENVSGGIGLAIRDVDDGRTIVTFLLEDGPAAEAGIEVAAEIVAINDVPIDEWVDAAVAYSAPFSTDHVARLQKLRYAVRFPIDTELQITFQNPGADEPETADLIAIFERESFSASSFSQGATGFELPVEHEILESGYAYVRITSFFDNQLLTIQLWERLMQNLNDAGVPGVIVDMRQNGGGFGFLADQMAAYFFEESLVTGNTAAYDESAGEFILREEDADRYYLPPAELRYDGDLVVLVGPACASACEFFSYDLTLDNRATVIGQYPTAGLGGSVDDWAMPDGEMIRVTLGRAVDADGNIHIEGVGVVPDIVVPVTEETLFSTGDPVLDAAVEALINGLPEPTDADSGDGGNGDEVTAPELPENVVEGGEITIGETVTGTLEVGTRIWYTLTVSEGDLLNIYLNANALGYDPFLRLYDGEGNPLLENDDMGSKSLNAGLEELEIPADLVLIIEVTSFNETTGGAFTLTVENAAE